MKAEDPEISASTYPSETEHVQHATALHSYTAGLNERERESGQSGQICISRPWAHLDYKLGDRTYLQEEKDY